MRKSRFLCGLFLILASCKATEGVAPLVATTVDIVTAPNSITVNGTAQASAVVKDQNGAPLTGQTIRWSSLNPGVASVDSITGVIRGVAAGTATIQGKSGTVTGTGIVLVVAPSTACAAGPVVLDLAVGQVKVVTAAESKGCIKISTTGAASQYIVVAANTNPTPNVLGTFVLKSDEGETVPNTSLLADPYRVSRSLVVPPPEPADALQIAFESKLRLMERKELNIRDAQRAYRARAGELSHLRASLSVAVPNIGDKTTFKIPKPVYCTAFTTVTATAQYISNTAIIYTDDASPAGGFTATDFQDIGNEFDKLIYPTDVAYFGTPLDLDTNGRVIILYTPEVNRLTPSGNPNGFVGGFFFAGDLFPSTAPPLQTSCTNTNFAEIFYVLAPDPGGAINGNVRTTSTVRQGTRGVIAHEFQHMINLSNRIASPIDQGDEEIWLDEALAHFAEDVNGRALRGLPDDANATFETLSANSDDYFAFFFQNFARLQRFMAPTGGTTTGYFSPTGSAADTSLAVRGAAWSLLRYAADNYAPGGDIKAFTRALAGGPNVGVNNLLLRSGSIPFDTLIAGWMVSLYADDAGIPGLPAKYSFKSYNLRSNMSARTISPSRQFPLQINDITGSGFVANNQQARAGSGDYYRFARAPAGPARTFRMLNTDGTTSASFTGASFFILRTQ